MFIFQGIVVAIIQFSCCCKQKRQPFAIKLNGWFTLTGFAYFWAFFCLDYNDSYYSVYNETYNYY